MGERIQREGELGRKMIMSPRQTALKNGDMFYEGKPCKKGHTRRYTQGRGCVVCEKERLSQYWLDNKEQMNARTRQWKLDNEKEHKEQRRQYFQRPDVKKEKYAYLRKRYKENKLFRIKKLIQNSLWRYCKNRREKKNGRTEELLGYTVKELKEHLESLFKEGMTWDNQGEWHIDHIIPQSYFTSIDQIRECFALDNLKPEWAEWNMSKGNRFIG